jgi:hypothetical protein
VLARFPLAGGYFALFYLPLLMYVARWAGDGSARFWWSLLAAVLVYTPLAAAI